jgi:multiple sugar transport system substrate-binding protein
MKFTRYSCRPRHGVRVAGLGAAALVMSMSAAHAATEIRLWHSLSPYNAQIFEDLVDDFNGSQDKVKVRLKGFVSEDEVEAALVQAKTTSTRPHLVQLDDDRSPEKVAARPYMQPLHVLLAKYPIKDAKWFVSEQATFARDGKGRLLAFPYMLDIPVMYYNIDAFKRAKLSPAAPDRVWINLQAQLVDLANNGSRRCPLTTDQSVSVNLENLAAVNNQLFLAEPPARGKAAAEFSFDSLYIRHLALMISWVKTELMVKPTFASKAVERFGNKECAVLISSSSNIGQFKNVRGLDFSLTGLPYYPEVTKSPGSPFVGGSALWVTAGHAKEGDEASAAFLAWLAQPKHAAAWYQKTGFLPLTHQAFDATDKSYYRGLGDWQQQVAAYAKNPAVNGRGFRIDNYPTIRAMFHQTLEKALSGNQPAVTALKSAADEASRMVKQK